MEGVRRLMMMVVVLFFTCSRMVLAQTTDVTDIGTEQSTDIATTEASISVGSTGATGSTNAMGSTGAMDPTDTGGTTTGDMGSTSTLGTTGAGGSSGTMGTTDAGGSTVIIGSTGIIGSTDAGGSTDDGGSTNAGASTDVRGSTDAVGNITTIMGSTEAVGNSTSTLSTTDAMAKSTGAMSTTDAIGNTTGAIGSTEALGNSTSTMTTADARDNATSPIVTTDNVSSTSTMGTSTNDKTTVAKIGPVPAPTQPQLDSDINKTFCFEVAVIEDTTEDCSSENLTSEACQSFISNFTKQLEDLYRTESENAFKEITDIKLRKGSIIFSHIVVYSYNDMDEEQRTQTAQQRYDETLGGAIADGTLGSYTFTECNNCENEETSQICDISEKQVACPINSKPACRDNYWVCESKCDTSYCSGHGICWQKNLNDPPICSCDWHAGEWYWGYSCQFYVNQFWLIIGCSIGGAVFIIFIIVLIYCGCRGRFAHDKVDGADDPIQAFHTLTAYSNNVFGDHDEGDIVSRHRPYSYIHTNPDTGVQEFRSFQTKHRNGVSNDKGKNASSGQSQVASPKDDFWGNLDEPGTGEQIQLHPVLDHIDTDESYQIQRPRISVTRSPLYAEPSARTNNYSYEPTALDRYPTGQSNHIYERTTDIPEPDYFQR